MKVEEARARVVLNSKACPTLEVGFRINGKWVFASSPSGTSTGKYEVKAWPRAPEIALAVEKAKRLLESEVFPLIVHRDLEPEEVDILLEEVDGKGDFSRIGGNAALATSMAFLKAYAQWRGEQLFEAIAEVYSFSPAPVLPLENFVGGGAHGGMSDIQEFLVTPKRRIDMKTAILMLAFLYRELKRLLKQRDPEFVGALTLESAYVTSLRTKEILDTLSHLTSLLEETTVPIALGVDVAASELWKDGRYHWRKEGFLFTPEEQLHFMESLAFEYDLFYIEDPFHQDDFESFVKLQRKIKGIVVGDDLFATNAGRLRKGIGGIIIKPNQRGTIRRAVETIKRARELDMKIIVSHRSGETEDTFLSHFAVGVGADYAKIGAAGIRITKLNELLRLSELF